MKKINFRQPKYMIPAIIYFPLLGTGYFGINIFTSKGNSGDDSNLQTTEYLNAELPSANVSDNIGSKRQNMRNIFGDIRDRSAIQNIQSDQDSLRKKEDYTSKYSAEEEEQLRLQEEERERARALAEMDSRLQESALKAKDIRGDDYALPVSDEELERALALRRKTMDGQAGRDLEKARQDGLEQLERMRSQSDSLANLERGSAPKAVVELDDNSDGHVVVKKTLSDSGYFNTLSENAPESSLIKAIIDEEVKAVDGSRVRLRLLDDVDIDGVALPKGSYLYCTMSGFASQRVKGKVQSILVGDELLKVNLSLYDSGDGLEGLFVPSSNFRETAKDIGSAAMQSSMNVNSGGYGGNSLTQWTGQALQSAYQRASQAVSKSIRKNRVRLKYGTHVYLVNSRSQQRKR